MTDLALFDLDNTLLCGDSDHAWGEYLCEIGAVDAVSYRDKNEQYYRQYTNGNINIREYLNFSLRPLAAHSPSVLLAWRRDFIREKIEPMITPGARALLDKHRDDTSVLITSTNRFITAPIANLLGVDALIATEPEYRYGRYTGAFESPPCFREGKVERLNAWLNDNTGTYATTWCYSDSENDRPLFEFVDKPVVVNGDSKLLKHAKACHWPCITI